MFDNDLMGVKNIYDLQLEFLSKNLLYFANHKGLLGDLFNIHLKNIQQKYWTSVCVGDQSDHIIMGKNHYIADALKLLKNSNFTICDHETINNNHHVKKGDMIRLEDIFSKIQYKRWRGSLKNRKIMFLKQCLEASGRKVLKWSHLCKKLNMSTKGVQPQWYKELIKTTTINDGSRSLLSRYVNMNKDWSYKNKLSIYDEEEKIEKNELITWNENNEVIIGKYKKKSSSKKFKKIGVHWITCNNSMTEDSPELTKCKGCNLNIKKASAPQNECLIYLKPSATRIINYRTLNTNSNEKMIKPYETLEELKLNNDTLIVLKGILDETELMINNNIDLVDRYVDAKTNDILLIKEYIDKFATYKDLNAKLEVVIKKESRDWKNKKKVLSRYRINIDLGAAPIMLKDDLKYLKLEININEIDVTKALIHGIIILLIIIGSSTSLTIEIKKSLIWILDNFQEEDSDRKKINSKYFLDLHTVMNLIESKNLLVTWKESVKKIDVKKGDDNKICDKTNRKDIEDEYLKIRLSNLDYNLFALRWKKNIIHGDYRNHVKTHNQLKYKSDILLSHYLEDVFYQNKLQEINWKRTFDLLRKGTSQNKFFTSTEDNNLRSYKIKNFLKILPTYNLLYERNCAHVITDCCPRCESEPETWEHIWVCDNNDATEYDIFIKSLIEIEEEYKNEDTGDSSKFKVLRTLNTELALFMQKKSNIFIVGSQTKIREITRGLFNNKLYDLTRNKIERQVVDEVWERSFLNIRKLIWLKRCCEVDEYEKAKGISKLLKKRKRSLSSIGESSNSDKSDVTDSGDKINNKKAKKHGKIENFKKEIIKDSLISNTVIINRHHSNVWGYVHRPDIIG